jgi:hypothetical protein
MSLTEFIKNLGFDPANFADEIKALDDRESIGRYYDTYFGETMDPSRDFSYRGVIDIMIDSQGRKIFRFNFNKVDGCGPMSYWWADMFYEKGVWVLISGNRTRPSYGCRDYPEKFKR